MIQVTKDCAQRHAWQKAEELTVKSAEDNCRKKNGHMRIVKANAYKILKGAAKEKFFGDSRHKRYNKHVQQQCDDGIRFCKRFGHALRRFFHVANTLFKPLVRLGQAELVEIGRA